MSDADFDKATPANMASYAPNFGALFILLSTHDMMHGGQFTVVRRKLGKPVLSISAVTGAGLSNLVRAVVEELNALPAATEVGV